MYPSLDDCFKFLGPFVSIRRAVVNDMCDRNRLREVVGIMYHICHVLYHVVIYRRPLTIIQH